MKTITLLAVLAVFALNFTGSLAKSSVGGPLADMLILIIAVLALGIYEAWLAKRGAIGWIASIVASIIGGFAGAYIGSMLMEMLLSALHWEGSLATSQHPLLYVLSAGEAIITMLGAWIVLQVADLYLPKTNAAKERFAMTP